MTIDVTRTVADLAGSLRGAAKTFEQLGIDYCCRGKQSLADAAREASLPLEELRAKLEQADDEAAAVAVPQDLPSLIRYIEDKHHVFTREELARLLPLAAKVARVHAGRHPELERVCELVDALAIDLLPHMLKEERVLFPYVRRLASGEDVRAPFGSAENPIRVMHIEHEQVGALLEELDAITHHYSAPADGCGSYRALYAGLAALQFDIHQHVHLENHVLFPAALKLEHKR